jgi:hypothetical protein
MPTIHAVAPAPEAPAPVSSSTTDVPVDPGAGARAVWLRRAFLALLVLIVAAGAADLLGVRSRTVSSAGEGGISLSVHYPQVARAGLAVPFEITVQSRKPFRGEVVLAMSRSYLDLFDRSGIDPQPTSETGDDQVLVWHFQPPRGRTLVVSLDMQVQGGRHFGKSGFVAVRRSGRDLARTTFTTYLAP